MPETPPEPDWEVTNSDEKDNGSNAATNAYQWWDNISRLDADDPIGLMALKILVRVLGIIVLIALSPFILIGLFFGLIAAL